MGIYVVRPADDFLNPIAWALCYHRGTMEINVTRLADDISNPIAQVVLLSIYTSQKAPLLVLYNSAKNSSPSHLNAPAAHYMPSDDCVTSIVLRC